MSANLRVVKWVAGGPCGCQVIRNLCNPIPCNQLNATPVAVIAVHQLKYGAPHAHAPLHLAHCCIQTSGRRGGHAHCGVVPTTALLEVFACTHAA